MKPSFNFLVGQSYIIFLYVLALSFTMILLLMLPQIGNNILLENYVLFIIVGFPFFILYTFILVSILLHTNKIRIIYSKLFQISHILIPILLFLIMILPDAYNKDSVCITGFGIVIFLFFSILSIDVLFLLFTLIPYLIMHHKESKSNQVIKNPPFKNKVFNGVLLISVGFYLLTFSLCLIATVLLFFS